MNILKLLLIIAFCFMISVTKSQTVTKLLKSGTTGNKLDLVIIGDGFQSGTDQNDYNDFVNDFVIDGVFSEGPLWEDMNAFNIYRININSNESGVTQVDADGNVTTARNTALDYRYSGLWDRCWMERGPNTWSTLTSILDKYTPGWDYVFIILNETGFGGCAGGNNLAVTLGGTWTVGAHEMGHMVGNLADEYCRSGTYTGSEPSRVNVTTDSIRSSLKWKEFVNPTTPIPTGVNPNPGNGACTGYNRGSPPAGWSNDGDAGLFEGAMYHDSGIYRPVVNCRMRGNTPDFCPVCYHQMKTVMDSYHDYDFIKSYSGDFTGDGKCDIVIHNANSLALYQSVGTELEPLWIATGRIPVWDEFRNNDQFYVGDFNGDGKDDLYVFNYQDWLFPYFGMLLSNGTGFDCIRLFGPELPGWDDMKAHDQFYVGDFNGDGNDDIYVFNGRDWSMGYLELLKSTGNNLVYVRRYDNNLPGWGKMKKNDSFYVADINNDEKDDLYIFNGLDWSIAYLQMLGSNGSSLYHIQRYDEELPGWDDMKAHDRFFVADFNNDNKDDLYVFNGKDWSIEYLEMLRSTGTALNFTRRFDGDVPGWDGLAPNDHFYVADINGDNFDDLYVVNTTDWITEYLGILRSNGNNLSGGWQSDWIGNWNLGQVDRYLVGNFNGGANYDDLFVRNGNWFGLFRSHIYSLQLNSIYHFWIHRHNYHSSGLW